MSDTTPTPGSTPGTPASGAAAAQEAFGKYKARLAGGPVAMPVRVFPASTPLAFTATGTLEPVVLPSPSWPVELSPQQ